MSHEQCWGLHSDRRSRCEAPALPGGFFCARHQTLHGPHPIDIFCLPEADMPPEVVAHIRFARPDFVFPAAPVPELADTTVVPEPAPLSPAAALPQDDPAGAEPLSSVAPPSPDNPETREAGPLDWLLTTLREAIEGVMASDAKPLQKANAVSRLANLYLKTYRATELEKENRQLRKRLADLEARLAGGETPTAIPPPSRKSPPRSAAAGTLGQPVSAVTAAAPASGLAAASDGGAAGQVEQTQTLASVGGSRASP